MNPALDSRARFEAWHADWQRSTWTPLHGSDEMPAHWNTSAKRLMELAWQAAIASMAADWISVDEQLPPLNTEVLVAYQNDSLPSTGQYTASPHDDGGWCCAIEDEPKYVGPVTHWQLLPAPPTPQDPPIAALAAKETK